jgi:hypothetical protein
MIKWSKDFWLVVRSDEPEYFEKYKLFTTPEAAYAFARSVGFEDPFGMGQDDRVGFMNTYQAGDVNVGVLRITADEAVIIGAAHE